MKDERFSIYHFPFIICHLGKNPDINLNGRWQNQSHTAAEMKNDKWKMINGKSFILPLLSFRLHFFNYSAIFHLDNAIRKAGGQLTIVRDHHYRQRVVRSHAA